MKTVGLILTLFIIVMNSSCSLEKNLHAKRYVIRDNEPTQHGNKVENEKESLALNQVPDQPIPAVESEDSTLIDQDNVESYTSVDVAEVTQPLRELNPIYGTIFKSLESATVPNRIELKSSTSVQSDKPNDTNVKEGIKPGTAVGAILSICFSGTAVVVPIVAYLIFEGDKRGYDAIGIVLTITAAFSIIGLVLGFRVLKKIKNKSKRYKVLALVGVSLAGLVGLGFIVFQVWLTQGF